MNWAGTDSENEAKTTDCGETSHFSGECNEYLLNNVNFIVFEASLYTRYGKQSQTELMQEYIMNQVKNNMNSAVVQPVPLFASSWVALFCYFRNSLATAGAVARSNKAKASDKPTRH